MTRLISGTPLSMTTEPKLLIDLRSVSKTLQPTCSLRTLCPTNRIISVILQGSPTPWPGDSTMSSCIAKTRIWPSIRQDSMVHNVFQTLCYEEWYTVSPQLTSKNNWRHKGLTPKPTLQRSSLSSSKPDANLYIAPSLLFKNARRLLLDKPPRRRTSAPRNLSLIHISEPTRLGMISYAVFCLKKKK